MTVTHKGCGGTLFVSRTGDVLICQRCSSEVYPSEYEPAGAVCMSAFMPEDVDAAKERRQRLRVIQGGMV